MKPGRAQEAFGQLRQAQAVTLVGGPVQGPELDFDPYGSLPVQDILLVHESVINSE